MSWRKWRKNMIKKIIWRNQAKYFMIITMLLLTFLLNLSDSNIIYAAKITDERSLSDIYKNRETMKVIHHRSYICGDEVEEIGRLTFEQTLEIMANYPEWEITTDDNRAVIRLKESISDLSSYCKENAYIGISIINDLSLFDGAPENNKVIKTFYQLNVPYMESHLNEDELKKVKSGIKIHTIDEYESVIATFSEYSTEKQDLVCRPYY